MKVVEGWADESVKFDTISFTWKTKICSI
jgi:hypothetical protein